jgi:hypothetical protein
MAAHDGEGSESGIEARAGIQANAKQLLAMARPRTAP